MLEPLPASRWNFSTAAHLLNRAGFGGTPSELEALGALPFQEAVEQWVEASAPAFVPANAGWARFDPREAAEREEMKSATPERRRELERAHRRRVMQETADMQHAWLEGMVRTPAPLQEKLTLFWHGHFATSLIKVRSPYLMWRQNELFRLHGRGSWRNLLGEVARDPAMLVWLDQAQSRASHPNENFARELMELFSLGEGNYTEADIAEAARAFTGFSVDRHRWEFVFRSEQHDAGTKTVLNKSGRLHGDDVLDVLAESPQSALFITGRLWNYFAGSPPGPGLNQALATEFIRQGRQFKPWLRTVFKAEAFYDPTVVRRQIKSPVQLLVMACRQLERPLPPAPLPVNALRLLGQELFMPPSVKGWDGGTAWINTNTLLTRHNLALLLVEGQNVLPISAQRPAIRAVLERMTAHLETPPASPSRLLSKEDLSSTETVLAALQRRFLQAPFSSKSNSTLGDYLRTAKSDDNASLLSVIRLALCTPEYQLT
jgi:hypothetical protein